MPRRHFDGLVPQRQLRLPNVPACQLCANKAPEVVRLHMSKAHAPCILLHREPDGGFAHRLRLGAIAATGKGCEEIGRGDACDHPRIDPGQVEERETVVGFQGVFIQS